MDQEYHLLWRNKFLTLDAQTLDDMLNGLESAVAQLQEMRNVGVLLEGGAKNDYCTASDLRPSNRQEIRVLGMEKGLKG